MLPETKLDKLLQSSTVKYEQFLFRLQLRSQDTEQRVHGGQSLFHVHVPLPSCGSISTASGDLFTHAHKATGILYVPGLHPGDTKQKSKSNDQHWVYCLIYIVHSTCKCLSGLFSVLTTTGISRQRQKLSTTNTTRKQEKLKSFLADAENSQMFDHSHTSKEKTDFFALCWTAEGKDEKNSPREASFPILQVWLTKHDEGQGWNVLLKTSEVGKQEKCSKHQPLFMEMLHNQLKHPVPFLHLHSQEKNKGLCAVKGPRGDEGTEQALWENHELLETGAWKGLTLMLLFQKQGSTGLYVLCWVFFIKGHFSYPKSRNYLINYISGCISSIPAIWPERYLKVWTEFLNQISIHKTCI